MNFVYEELHIVHAGNRGKNIFNQLMDLRSFAEISVLKHRTADDQQRFQKYLPYSDRRRFECVCKDSVFRPCKHLANNVLRSLVEAMKRLSRNKLNAIQVFLANQTNHVFSFRRQKQDVFHFVLIVEEVFVAAVLYGQPTDFTDSFGVNLVSPAWTDVVYLYWVSAI